MSLGFSTDMGFGPGLGFSGSSAFSPASLFSGGEDGAWYDPSDLSTLWKDTAGTDPVTADGDAVARMDDKSDNGHNLTQGTVANRPLYKTSGGLHWLLFDGSDDTLVSAAGQTLKMPTYLAVGLSKRAQDGASMLEVFEGSADYVRLVNVASSSRVGGQLRLNSQSVATSQTTSLSNEFPVDTAKVAEVLATSGNLELRIDGGTAQTTATGWTTEEGTANGASFRIFGNAITGKEFWGGLFLIGRAPTDDERTNVREYLADKSGVTL